MRKEKTSYSKGDDFLKYAYNDFHIIVYDQIFK